MPRSIGALLRPAALLVLAALVAACVPAERQRLGPPAMGIKEAREFGAAPVKSTEGATFAFLTVTGIPGQMRFDLEAALKKYAATRNLTILVADGPAATYRVKGYLSAIGDQNGTLLVYTWDVLDPAGTPLHRISGQQTASGSSTDPWAGIGGTQIDDAARETIDKLADWVRG